jgi:hypothetical protein
MSELVHDLNMTVSFPSYAPPQFSRGRRCLANIYGQWVHSPRFWSAGPAAVAVRRDRRQEHL